MEALRFAATKIQPPRPRATRVERPLLDAAITRALQDHRAVLLQAPAGFGKTSALASQLGQRAGWATAWVSLDEDDDAERLFACLVAALEPHDLPWRTSPDALVAMVGSASGSHAGGDNGGDSGGLRRAAAELLNALGEAGVERGVIVLDDLHRVGEPSTFVLLDALIERLPQPWTLVLASRTAPPLALARLRASGELAEFNQDDLRFSAGEAAALLAAEALPHTAERARDLFERTGGWPAGLRLALAALRTRGGQGQTRAGGNQLIDRHLFDYLAAEVLDDMPEALHDFLLRCAVLPELTAARAAAVSGDRRAAEWLDEIERRGLFATTLEAQERTLVLHDLFRDALLARLGQRLPGELPALLRRAAAGETDALRRVGFLLRAQDWPAAEAALAEAAAELFLQGGAGEVLRLVEQFPAGQHSARLARLAAAACCLRWQWGEMARWCEQAIATAPDSDDGERQVAQAYLASALYPLDRNAEAEQLIATLHAQTLPPGARALTLLADASQHFRRGEHVRLPALYGELLDILERGESLFRWWECAPPINWSTIAGMPSLLARYVSGVLQRVGDRPLPMRGESRLLRAFSHLWAGRMADAQAEIQAAEDDIKWLAVSGEMLVDVELFRTLFEGLHGRGEVVRQRLEARIARQTSGSPASLALHRHHMAVYGVRLSDSTGANPEALEYWAAMLKEDPLRSPHSNVPRAIAVRARYAAAQGRWADAVLQFEKILPKLHEMDVMGQRTDLSLRAGHALLRLQRLPEAAAVVAPVLDRLLAEGVRGQALLCGPVVLQTLADTRWGSLLTAGQRAELAAAAQLSASLHGQSVAPAPAADEGLSGREREVLERIAAGDSNKLIARALDISPHTVKRHVANILDKLGLTSRGQAGAWLRENG